MTLNTSISSRGPPFNFMEFPYFYSIMNPGISESERQRRKDSNNFVAKINFLAWLLEVILSLYKFRYLSLNITSTSFIIRIVMLMSTTT